MAGHYLKNRDYKKIDEWLQYILSSGEDGHFDDVDYFIRSITRDLWIPITEEIYDYIVEKKEREKIDIDVGIFLPLKGTYEPLEVPTYVSLENMDETEPPIIEISVGKPLKKHYPEYHRAKIEHPFNNKKFKTYYWGNYENYIDEDTHQEVNYYYGYVLLHK